MSWRTWRGVLLAFLFAQIMCGLLSACTAPQVLTTVLGPPVETKEAKRDLRRPTYKPWEELTMEYDLVSPEKINWPDKLALLPQLENGEINWSKAFKDGMIKPKAGLDDKAEDKDTEDNVVELIPEGSPEDKAIFPHLPHTQLLVCRSCHPSIFKKEAGADPITMKKIKAGEYCGRCHGPVSFDAKNCELCHPG